MTEIIWDTSDLLKYCPEHCTQEASIYFKAVRDKIDRILYAVQRVKNHPPLLQNSLNFQDFRKQQLEIVIDLETIAYNLHSIPDVLANIIKILIINPLLSKDASLDFKKIKDINIVAIRNKLEVIQPKSYINSQQGRHIQNLSKAIDNLLSSDYYKYVSALVNTIKHRNLIDTEYAEKIGDSKYIYLDSSALQINVIDEGLIRNWYLIKFERDGKEYSSITSDKLINEYRENIIDLFLLAGREINNYCLATSISNSST